jgi:hypothetical protein
LFLKDAFTGGYHHRLISIGPPGLEAGLGICERVKISSVILSEDERLVRISNAYDRVRVEGPSRFCPTASDERKELLSVGSLTPPSQVERDDAFHL